jgi:secreted PhoX family phosphatase
MSTTRRPPASHLLPLFDVGGCARFGIGRDTCRWKCGSQCAHPAPNRTPGESFGDILRRAVSRRALLRAAGVGGAMLVVGPAARRPAAATQGQPGALTFKPITLNTDDRITVPEGYTSAVLIRWGDPLFFDSPPFNPGDQSAAAQERQFGYNNDFIGFFPLPEAINGDRALLVVNHEYTNPELMFFVYNEEAPSRTQVDVELAAHGMTVVELLKTGRVWRYLRGSFYNRRITAETRMLLTGPAAGHPWLQTGDDPTGTIVRGMLNNCSGGKTPWGTVLTCEENFNQYFAHLDRLPDADPRKAVHRRYGLPTGASERKWERFYSRFDLSREPNEPFRFGWTVEIDPYDPTATPHKRTALGRFKHEGATFLVGQDGRVGVYMGDDERFDYVYKFVTAGRFNPSNRAANRDLLDSGTLYVAKFRDDGTGEWVPLVFGQGPLTPSGGFSSQADVLIKTRLAADAVGATKMDRPEDIEVNPLSRKIYLVMTNNTRRTMEQVDAANPRANNRDGHIIELTEADDNPTATRFTWSIFMLCGDPATDPSTYFAGFPKDQLSAISTPDNLIFDRHGNLWIFTDGQPGTIRRNDAVFAVPTAGPERGHLKPFLSAVPGAETASGDLSDDNEALFVSIQHPGEGGSLVRPLSRFPDGTDLPRPSVVVAWKTGSGEARIGS